MTAQYPQPPALTENNKCAQNQFYDLVADLAAYRATFSQHGYTPEQIEAIILHAVEPKVDPAEGHALLYPKYWKPIPLEWRYLDYYRIRSLFPSHDPSTRIDHAFKKLLIPGVRTGGKSLFHDIREARDTLNAWIIDNPKGLTPP